MTEQFKIGDKLRIKGRPGYYDISNYPKEFVVYTIRSTPSGFCYHTKDQSQGAFENDLELVEESKTDLRVGDIVNVSVPRDSNVWELDGKTGKVNTIGENSDYPFNVIFEGGDEYNFKSTELEKIE